MLLKWYTSLAAGAIVAFTVPSIAGPALSSRTQEQNASQLAASDQMLGSLFPNHSPQLGSGDAANSGQFPMPLCHGFKLEEATIDQLQNAMNKGTLSSMKIVMCYLQRIYQTDSYLRYEAYALPQHRLTRFQGHHGGESRFPSNCRNT